jgi:hypothetical protein
MSASWYYASIHPSFPVGCALRTDTPQDPREKSPRPPRKLPSQPLRGDLCESLTYSVCHKFLPFGGSQIPLNPSSVRLENCMSAFGPLTPTLSITHMWRSG